MRRSELGHDSLGFLGDGWSRNASLKWVRRVADGVNSLVGCRLKKTKKKRRIKRKNDPSYRRAERRVALSLPTPSIGNTLRAVFYALETLQPDFRPWWGSDHGRKPTNKGITDVETLQPDFRPCGVSDHRRRPTNRGIIRLGIASFTALCEAGARDLTV